MENSDKNRSEAQSYAVSEAATILGVSIPTLKRMAEEGRVESFRTPGRHLRILAESVEALRECRPARPRPVLDASPVLQNRRERLEELTIEAQEMRARREVEKLKRDEQEEAERREAEAEARKQEAAQRQAELELEQARLEQEQDQLEQERAKERQRREAERELAALRRRWVDQANEALSAYEYGWLSAAQRKEVLEGLEAEIERRQPSDQPRMAAIIARSLEALVEPLRMERKALEIRQRLTERALWSLPYSANEAERVRATAAIREALRRFDSCADECEMRVAAEEAVWPFKQTVARRELDAKLIRCAIFELPWSRTDRDEARLRRECAEILAELPIDVSEAEAKEDLEPIVSEVRQEIEERQAQKERQVRRAGLIQQGVAEVSSYLLELQREGEISAEDYWDSDLTADLKEAVRRGLEADLSGDETSKDVKELAHQIVDEEFG